MSLKHFAVPVVALVLTLAYSSPDTHAQAVSPAQIATASLPNADKSSVPLGVNLEGMADYMRMPMFVDAMRTSRRFGSADKPWDGVAPLDKDGYPTTDAGSCVITDLPHMGGAYHFSCTGKTDLGTVSSNAKITDLKYDAAANKTTAEVDVADSSTQLILTLKNTVGGVRDIHLIRPGYPSNTKQIFTNEFLQMIRPFSVVRLMDYLQTNGSPVAHWSDRAKTTDAQWTVGKGAPWEVAIAMANQANKDLWVNIPDQADDDYVRQLALLFKSSLNPSHKIYIEYSNEVWNSGFSQYGRTQAAAEKEAQDPKSTLRTVGGVQWDDANNKYYWGTKRIAERLLQISTIWQGVYGKQSLNNTIRPVLASQIGYTFLLQLQLGYITKNYGPPSGYIYAIAGAPYFNLEDSVLKDPNVTVDAVLASLGKSIDKFQSTDLLTYGKLAAQNKVKYFAYEGGPDIGQNDAGVANKIAANRDPRMKDLIVRFLHAWYSNGGSLFMYFDLTGGYSKWGCWGLTDDITQSTPKIEGLAEIMKTPPPPVRPEVQIPLTH